MVRLSNAVSHSAAVVFSAVEDRGHNRSQHSAGKHRVDNGPHQDGLPS